MHKLATNKPFVVRIPEGPKVKLPRITEGQVFVVWCVVFGLCAVWAVFRRLM